jgi:hypothetical protein
MTDLLAAALEYVHAGVAVFPARITVTNGHKSVTPIAEWRKASTKSPEMVRTWFAPGQRWAEASLCIDCGKSALVVIDLDEGEGKTGLATWAALVAEHNLPITGARARTPSGGEHWYYREHRQRVVGIDSSGKVAHGIDIRGLGGFAIAWPSEDSRGTYGQVDLEALATAPIVPDFVIERMNDRPAAASPAVPTARAPTTSDELWRSVTPPRAFTVEQARGFCMAPLEAFRALRTPEDTGFNAKLNALACTWSHFIPAFMDAGIAEEHLYAAALANRSVEWQGEQGVRSTIRSGLNQQRDPWKAVRVEDGALAPENDELVRDRFPRLDWHILWEDENPEEWIIEPVLPARRLIALYSPPKIGKSLLSLELAVGIARGTTVLGYEPDRARRVLYVDFENDPKGDIKPRLIAMGFGPDDLDYLDYLSFPALGPLDTAPGAADLLGAVDAYRSEVVVIDTVSRAIKGEENENDTWLAFYRHTGRWLKARGVALIRLDHTGKDETKGQRGASAKSGDVDMVWRLSKVTETVYRLDCEAKRMQVLETSLILHRETTPKLWHRVDAMGRFGAWQAKIEQIMRALDEAGVDANASRRTIQPILKTMGLSARNDLLTEVVRKRSLSGPRDQTGGPGDQG